MDSLLMTRIDRFAKWICKTTYRLTHTHQYKHNKNLWPYFKVERTPAGTIEAVYFKHKKINTVAVDRVERSKPLVIMATGPSVNNIEPSFFNDRFDYLGVNGALSMPSVSFSWYVIIDRNFVIKRLELVKSLVARADMIVFCAYTSLESICSYIPWDEIRCQFKIFETSSSTRIRRFMEPTMPIKPNDEHYYWYNEIGFSDDLDRCLFDYGTVAYPALQIACILGYKEIYIAGLDMNNFSTPRFYETPEDKLSTRLDLDFDDISRSFDTAQSYCKKNNIRVINLSPTSAINAFPKLNWDRVDKSA